ncbi:hypothetical protein VTK73DRAFT_2909 [Phialemonium thermophilum]|uniref:Uncharacterized protein n=1 Tax=Phialemonium thermophilum TaxID=223376 RepID=A0ABR3VN04_9PEZI
MTISETWTHGSRERTRIGPSMVHRAGEERVPQKISSTASRRRYTLVWAEMNSGAGGDADRNMLLRGRERPNSRFRHQEAKTRREPSLRTVWDDLTRSCLSITVSLDKPPRRGSCRHSDDKVRARESQDREPRMCDSPRTGMVPHGRRTRRIRLGGRRDETTNRGQGRGEQGAWLLWRTKLPGAITEPGNELTSSPPPTAGDVLRQNAALFHRRAWMTRDDGASTNQVAERRADHAERGGECGGCETEGGRRSMAWRCVTTASWARRAMASFHFTASMDCLRGHMGPCYEWMKRAVWAGSCSRPRPGWAVRGFRGFLRGWLSRLGDASPAHAWKQARAGSPRSDAPPSRGPPRGMIEIWGMRGGDPGSTSSSSSSSSSGRRGFRLFPRQAQRPVPSHVVSRGIPCFAFP